MGKKALVSTIKTVVQVVQNLDESRKLFEDGLKLKCVDEVETDSFWSLSDGNYRMARFAREGEDFGGIDLIENKDANETIRDDKRPFDYGIMTLNYRTNDIEKAIPHLEKFGAKPVSEILNYDVGKPMQECMMTTSTGERLTILQIGDANKYAPIFEEAIATIGMSVPSMKDAQEFYKGVLGLDLAITFQASGSPFDTLLGVSALDKLDFATLTSDGNWTGKVELLELEIPNETAVEPIADGTKTGYWMNTFLTEHLDILADKFDEKIIEIERPFHGKCRAFLVKASSGELTEFIEI